MEKISVIIPVHNGRDFVAQAVKSVLGQTAPPLEAIVVDDGSTDDTREVLGPYMERVLYFYKENGGVASARNLGIKKSRGDYIAFLDSDDLWFPEKLEEVCRVIRLNRDAGFIYSSGYSIDARGRITGRPKTGDYGGKLYGALLKGAGVINSSVVVKRECFERCGFFHEGFQARAGAEDWDMWIRIARYFQGVYIGKPLVCYRVHGKNVSRKEFAKLNADILSVLERAFGDDSAIPPGLKKRALGAAFYLRGRKYLAALKVGEARRELGKSIKLDPFQAKAYLLYLVSLMNIEAVRAVRGLFKRGVHNESGLSGP